MIDEMSQGQYRGYPSKCSLGQVQTKVEKKNKGVEVGLGRQGIKARSGTVFKWTAVEQQSVDTL